MKNVCISKLADMKGSEEEFSELVQFKLFSDVR